MVFRAHISRTMWRAVHRDLRLLPNCSSSLCQKAFAPSLKIPRRSKFALITPNLPSTLFHLKSFLGSSFTISLALALRSNTTVAFNYYPPSAHIGTKQLSATQHYGRESPSFGSVAMSDVLALPQVRPSQRAERIERGICLGLP